MQQIHLIISGFVQGVGYRQFVKQQAKRLVITGWVKNTPDGNVELVAQGKENTLEELVALCKKGSLLAEVKNIVVEKELVTTVYPEFTVVH